MIQSNTETEPEPNPPQLPTKLPTGPAASSRGCPAAQNSQRSNRPPEMTQPAGEFPKNPLPEANGKFAPWK